MKRYELYADEIAELIRSGALRPGDRLPSVREAGATRRISASTVFEAYYLLEARGLIEARPRSGYYVKARPAQVALAEPETSVPADRSVAVEISELVFEVIGAAAQRERMPLGSAFPAPALFPLPQLARHMASGMRELDARALVEDLAAGHEPLRRHIALRYGVGGVRIDAGEIVVANGAMEALNLSLQAVTQPGDVVAVESPAFYAALQALERLGLQAVEIATHPRDGIDLDALAAALARHPLKACWLMTNFQNPLGSLMPEGSKRALVALLARHEVPLIEDDVYAELYFGAQRPLPAKAFDEAGLVLHCSSFSKCLAPGYRVGWVAAGRFARRIERMRLMSSLSPAIPSQQAIARYLSQGGYDRHLRRLRAALQDHQASALAAIRAHFPEGTRTTVPQGGYFLWVQLPAGIDALQLHRLALAQQISIAPGHVFSADRRFTNCVRINYGHGADPRFEAALRTVGELARGLLLRQPAARPFSAASPASG